MIAALEVFHGTPAVSVACTLDELDLPEAIRSEAVAILSAMVKEGCFRSTENGYSPATSLPTGPGSSLAMLLKHKLICKLEGTSEFQLTEPCANAMQIDYHLSQPAKVLQSARTQSFLSCQHSSS
jgi:hypothetical protein